MPCGRLVLEGTLTGEDHGDVCVVRAVDDVPVADRAAGLDDRGDALADADFKAVAEREERIRHHRAAGKAALLGPRLLHDLGLLPRAVLVAEDEAQVVERLAELLPCQPVRMLRVGLVARDLGDAHAVLLARADADRHAVLDVEDRVGGDARLDEPAEDEVGALLLRREALDPVLLERDGWYGEVVCRQGKRKDSRLSCFRSTFFRYGSGDFCPDE